MYRYEKETASLKVWLGRCESLCCPDTELLSADKVKLRHELQHVQVKIIAPLFLLASMTLH